MKLTLSSFTDNEGHNLYPIVSFSHHSKLQCMLKSFTQSVYLLFQSSSFEDVYSFLFCIQPLYPQGYQKILLLERKVFFILLIQVTKFPGITPLCHSQSVYQECLLIYVHKTHLVSHLLHITPLLHFSGHPINLLFEKIATTNINFQLLHCQVHSFEARLILMLG